jgi:hypothetical protein
MANNLKCNEIPVVGAMSAHLFLTQIFKKCISKLTKNVPDEASFAV